MITEEIREELFSLADEKYRDFQSNLTPTVDGDHMIGVRTPALRKLAKQFAKEEEIGQFLSDLPHHFFEENQLQAFIIAQMKDFDACITEVVRFLPYVDNWATCDQMNPKVFKKHKTALLPYINEWIESDKTYTMRFAIKALMDHFLEEDFDPSYPAMVATVRSEEYYVRMMIAWYFATALAKQYEKVLPFLEECRLDPWSHNKAIQKSIESYRITPEQKAYLRTLKIKKK